jgi:urea transport system ATP-binding protein
MTREERNQTGRTLQKLASHHTVIVVEHDMDFLRRFARTVTVMHEGRVLKEGSVGEVQEDPAVREVYLGKRRDRATVEEVPVTC